MSTLFQGAGNPEEGKGQTAEVSAAFPKADAGTQEKILRTVTFCGVLSFKCMGQWCLLP